METDKDYIHVLLQYNPTDSVSKIVSTLKQYSTYSAWKYHASTLRKYYWGDKHVLWTGGYFAASVGNASEETIERYIANQG